ncbi:DUF4142 domain-containing protein [Methylobacterium sp. P31]
MGRFAALAVGLLLVGPAMAESVPEKLGLNSLIGSSPSAQDFVTEAALSDMFEIQSSLIAKSRGDIATRPFAGQMIADHEKIRSELKAMADGGKLKISFPPQLDSKRQSKLDVLNKKQGGDFDKQYRSEQAAGHKDAVDLYRRYAKGGDNADLKSFAEKALPILEHHLQMAEELAK